MLDFLIDTLATWRLTSLLYREEGVFSIFDRARDFVGIRYNEYNVAYADNEVGKAFLCFWCLSIWVSGFIRWIPMRLRYVMAVSAFAIFIERFPNEK